MMFFDMKFSSIVKQCINFRNSLLEDGYYLVLSYTETNNSRRHWLFKHKNGHKRYVTLDVACSDWCVTDDKGRILIRAAADAK